MTKRTATVLAGGVVGAAGAVAVMRSAIRHFPRVAAAGVAAAGVAAAGGAWAQAHDAAHLLVESVAIVGLAVLLKRTVRYWEARQQRHERLENIIEREERQQSLFDSHKLLRAVVDGVNDAVFVKDLQLRYLLINPAAAAALLGVPPRQALGKRDEDFLSVESVRNVRETCEAVIRTGRPTQVEETLTGATGTRVYLSTKVPYRDDHGRIIGLLGIAHDITDRKRMEEELRRSHERVVDVLESISDGFFALDRQFRFTYINQRAEELLGLSSRTDLGRTIQEFWPDATASIFQRQLAKAMTDRVSVTFEGEHRGYWYEVHAYPNADGITVYFQEITDRKLAAMSLAESERRYQLVAKATTDLVWDWDAQADRVYVNDAAGTILRYPKEEIGLTLQWWIDRVHPDDRARVVEGFYATLAGTEEHWSAEYRFRRGDDTYADVLDRAYILRDDRGQVARAIGSIKDLTERKRAAQLEQERNGLRAAIKAMDRVLGVVGHELRTPLAGMRATAELLLDLPRESENFGQFLRAIHDESIRMSQVVNDLLEVARLNSGTARWNWSAFAPLNACDEAMRSIRPLVDERRVTLSVTGQGPATTMRGDADAVRRLVLNLLTNACKHTREGSIEVTASASRDGAGGAWVVIEVRDTGKGMTAETAAKLGEAFALNVGMVGDHSCGSGLGLAICQGIVAAHGGRIAVRSAVGVGTTITVRLRADLAAPSDAAAAAISFTPRFEEAVPAA